MGRYVSAAGNTMVGLAAIGFVLLGAMLLQQALITQAINRGPAPSLNLGTEHNPSLDWDGGGTPAPLTAHVGADVSEPPVAATDDGVAKQLAVEGTIEGARPTESSASASASEPPQVAASPPSSRSAPAASGPVPAAPPSIARAPSVPPASAGGAAASAAPSHEITRIAIPSIGLESRVALAKYVSAGGGTWQIPPYIVGHAQFTAGAGEIGNALLFGHVTSVSVGNVFETLDRVQVGDLVDIFSDDGGYQYRVVDIQAVSRDDLSLLGPTVNASVSLITCTGNWLPLERDYDQRLIVRAVLASQ